MSASNYNNTSKNAFELLKFAALILLPVLGYVGPVLFMFIYLIFYRIDVLAVVFLAILLQFSSVLVKFLDIYWISYQMDKKVIVDEWNKLILALLLGIATLYVIFLVGLQINNFDGAIVVNMVLFTILVVLLFHYSVVVLSEFKDSLNDIEMRELFLDLTCKYLSSWRFYFLVSLIISVPVAIIYVSVPLVSIPMFLLAILIAICWVYESASTTVENDLNSKSIAEGKPAVFVRSTLDARIPLYNIVPSTNKLAVFFGGVDSHLPGLINQLFNAGAPWGLDSLIIVEVSFSSLNKLNIVHIERDYVNAEKTRKTEITSADASNDSESTIHKKLVERYVLSLTFDPNEFIGRSQISSIVSWRFDLAVVELMSGSSIDFAFVLKSADRYLTNIISSTQSVIAEVIKNIDKKINLDSLLSLYILSLLLLVIDGLNGKNYLEYERYLANVLCGIKANKKLLREVPGIVKGLGLENSIDLLKILRGALTISKKLCWETQSKTFGLELIIRALDIEINKSLLKSDKFEELYHKMTQPRIEIKILETLPIKGGISTHYS